jgi:hypothetical protein
VGSVHLSLAMAALLFDARLCSLGSKDRGRVADGGMVSIDSHARPSSTVLYVSEQRIFDRELASHFRLL